jgi:hypothetical protein
MAASGDPAAPLYSVRPADFVAARDKLAAELRRQGHKDEAAAVKALPRPSPSVWAINQLAAGDPQGIQRLISASRALERAQGVEGEAGRKAYREALAAQRSALEHLTERARQTLEGAGLGAGRPVLDRIASDLRSAVLDPGAETQLQSGRLVRDLGQADFSALLDRLPGPRSSQGEPRSRPHTGTTGPAARADDQEARAARRKRLAEVKARLDEAEEKLAKAEDDARTARRSRSKAEARLVTLKQELADAEVAAREAGQADELAAKALARATSVRDSLIAERDAQAD